MRQPASLSNALPRHDHHEYGPGPVARVARAARRPRRLAEPASRGTHAPPEEAALLEVALPVLEVGLAVRDVEVAGDDHGLARAAARSSRCVTASRKAYLTSWRSVPASPVCTYAETTVSGPASVVEVGLDPAPRVGELARRCRRAPPCAAARDHGDAGPPFGASPPCGPPTSGPDLRRPAPCRARRRRLEPPGGTARRAGPR